MPWHSATVVRRRLWRYIDGGGKSKYCIVGNFCLHTFIGVKWGWRYIRVWLCGTPPNLRSSYVPEGPTHGEFCTSRNCVRMWSTIWLTPWSRILPEMLTDSQLIKKFPGFCGSRRFITAFGSARQLPLSWARATQSMLPHPTSWRSVLIFSPSTHGSSKWPLSDGSLRGQLCMHMHIYVYLCACVLYIYIHSGGCLL
jgi:hypothetical protein